MLLESQHGWCRGDTITLLRFETISTDLDNDTRFVESPISRSGDRGKPLQPVPHLRHRLFMECELHIGGLPHLDRERLLNIEVFQGSSRDREAAITLVVDGHAILGIPYDSPLRADQPLWSYPSDGRFLVLH